MLKVEIWPAFLNKCLFEIKEAEAGYQLLLTKDAVAELNDLGNIWIGTIPNRGEAEKALSMAKGILQHPTLDRRILLDGVSVKVNFLGESFKFASPEPDTAEQDFVAQLFALARGCFRHPECMDYLELLAEYFFDACPVVAFPGNPYRLKLIGTIGDAYSDLLAEHLVLFKNQPAGILDLSNFRNMSRHFDEYLKSLIGSETVSIYANPWVANFLESLGFDRTAIFIGRPDN